MTRTSSAPETLGRFLFLLACAATFQAAVALPPATAQCGVQRLQGGTTDGGDLFGSALVMDGADLFIGSPGADVFFLREGAVFRFGGAADSFTQNVRLTSPAPQLGDRFGAALAHSGDILAVGAPGANGAQVSSGKVFLFLKVVSNYLFLTELEAQDGRSGDNFGAALAFDGDRLLVGAPDHDLLSADDGAVYVFEGVGASWSQSAKLQSSQPSVGAGFGSAVTASEGRVLVGAPRATLFGIPFAGQVERLVETPTSYAFTSLVPTPILGIGALFGATLASDGDLAVVGAPGFNQFVGTAAGSAWTVDLAAGAPEAELLEILDASPGDEAGSALAVDGDFVYVGRPRRIAFGLPNQGAIDRFERTANGFVHRARLDAWSALERPGFGSAIAASGSTLVAGGPLEWPGGDITGFETGAVYAHDLNVALDPLTICPPEISVAAGGACDLRVRTGLAQSFLLTVVTTSGSTPGMALDSQIIPIVPDALTFAVLDGLPLIERAFALADPLGEHRPRLLLTPNSGSALLGSTLTVATVVWDGFVYSVEAPAGPAVVQVTP